MEKLTIFYNRRTGSVKELCGGEQDMNWFGDEKEDYEQIFDYLIVDYDDYIISNFSQLIVDNGQIKVVQESIPSKYL